MAQARRQRQFCVCLPWRKTFRQAPKKSTRPLPLAPLPSRTPWTCVQTMKCKQITLAKLQQNAASQSVDLWVPSGNIITGRQRGQDGGRGWRVRSGWGSQPRTARVINICCRGQLVAKIACLLLDFPLALLSPPPPHTTNNVASLVLQFA